MTSELFIYEYYITYQDYCDNFHHVQTKPLLTNKNSSALLCDKHGYDGNLLITLDCNLSEYF